MGGRKPGAVLRCRAQCLPRTLDPAVEWPFRRRKAIDEWQPGEPKGDLVTPKRDLLTPKGRERAISMGVVAAVGYEPSLVVRAPEAP